MKRMIVVKGPSQGYGNYLFTYLSFQHLLNPRGQLPEFSIIAAAAKLLQSCLTRCDPMDGSPPGSSVPGILQARILEWVAISFSNACMHAKSL